MLTAAFITAGRAVFTLDIPATFQASHGAPGHYTFRVKRKPASARWKEAYFVELLTGPDNTKNYTYLGMLNKDTGEVWTTRRSRFSNNTLVVRLLRRALACVWANNGTALELAGFQLHHEGQCCRCGRALTVPESIENGIGPECIKHVLGHRELVAV